MQLSLASLLCLGLVSATQPIPSVPGANNQLAEVLNRLNIQMVDCLSKKCKLKDYKNEWIVRLANQDNMRTLGCGYLYYQFRSPDGKIITINEDCGLAGTFIGQATHIQWEKGLFLVPLDPSRAVQFQFEKMLWRNGEVVAAVVQHPVIGLARNKGNFNLIRTLWINSPPEEIPLVEKEARILAPLLGLSY